MRTVLNWMKNQFSYFCNFYFLSYGRFSSQFLSVFRLFNLKPTKKKFTQKKNSSYVVNFTGKMRKELKRMKNQFSDFNNFYFLSYVEVFNFVPKIHQKIDQFWVQKRSLAKKKIGGALGPPHPPPGLRPWTTHILDWGS